MFETIKTQILKKKKKKIVCIFNLVSNKQLQLVSNERFELAEWRMKVTSCLESNPTWLMFR